MPAIIGWLKYSQMQRSLDLLDRLISMVQSVYRQIRFKKEPLRSILKAISVDETFSFSADNDDLVSRFVENLMNLDLPLKAVECVDGSFERLQVIDSDSACEELSLCLDRLTQIRDEFSVTVKTKSGMYMKLGLLAAAFVAVIMI